MKILRIISSVDPKAGGPVEGIRQITPALARLGHTTDVVTLDDPAAPWLTSFPADDLLVALVAGADRLRLCAPPRSLASRERFSL